MERYNFGLTGERIHLAIEGSTGGTSLGLHVAADVIEAGQRAVGIGRHAGSSTVFSALSAPLTGGKLSLPRHEFWRAF